VDPVETIKRLYYGTTRATIARDLARAVELLKSLPSEDDRERAAVYMDGLSQMRSEWGAASPRAPRSPSGAGQGRRVKHGGRR
jgi:hypothetical protein